MVFHIRKNLYFFFKKKWNSDEVVCQVYTAITFMVEGSPGGERSHVVLKYSQLYCVILVQEK
eukprot:SAG31_NODE_5242_length_2654_cov_9.856751_2_plen_62_part_00